MPSLSLADNTWSSKREPYRGKIDELLTVKSPNVTREVPTFQAPMESMTASSGGWALLPDPLSLGRARAPNLRPIAAAFT